MNINEITKQNKPYLISINDEKVKKIPIKIECFMQNNKSMYNTGFIFISKKKLQGKYILCCKDKDTLCIWKNINIRKFDENKYELQTLIPLSTDQVLKEPKKDKQGKYYALRKMVGIGVLISVGIIVIISMGVYKTHKIPAIENTPAVVKTHSKVQPKEKIKSKGYIVTDTTYADKKLKYITIDNSKYIPELVATNKLSSVATIAKTNKSPIVINASAILDENTIGMTYLNNDWISENECDADSLAFSNKTLSVLGNGYENNKKIIEKSQPTWVCTGINAVIFNTYSINNTDEEQVSRSFIGQLSDGNYVVGVIEDASYQDMINWARETFGYDINVLYNLNSGDNCAFFSDKQTNYEGTSMNTAIIFK